MLEWYVMLTFSAITFLIAYRDIKEKSLFYFLLNVFGILAGIIFEYPFITLGLWKHTLHPKFFGVSFYAAFMYIPWVTLTYSLSGKINKYFNKVYICYFLVGISIVFPIDAISVNLGFYQHTFNSVLRIFKVPIEMIIIEGISIAIFLALSERIIRFLIRSKH